MGTNIEKQLDMNWVGLREETIDWKYFREVALEKETENPDEKTVENPIDFYLKLTKMLMKTNWVVNLSAFDSLYDRCFQ